MSDYKVVASALGLKDDADEASILAALKTAGDEKTALAEKVAALEAAAVPEDKLAQLAADAAKGVAAAQRLHELERDTTITTAIEKGQFLPAQKDSLVALYDVSPEQFTALLAATPEKTFKPSGSSDDLRVGLEAVPAPVEIDGTQYAYDKDSAAIDIEAKRILAEQGKTKPSEAEYLQALSQAKNTLNVAA